MPGHRRRAVRTLDLIDDDSRILRCVRYSAVHDKQTTKCTSERKQYYHPARADFTSVLTVLPFFTTTPACHSTNPVFVRLSMPSMLM